MGKKSKRPNRATTTAPDADGILRPKNSRNDREPPQHTSCLHGALPCNEDSDIMVKYRKEHFDATLRALRDLVLPSGKSFSAAISACLEEFEKCHIMDQHMVDYTVEAGTNYALSSNKTHMNHAGLCCSMALTMEYWLKVGGDEFMQVMNSDHNSRQNHPWYAKWNKEILKIVTEKDIIKFLNKRTPCECLLPAKAEHKKDPKKKSCFACNKLVRDEDLLVCSRCKLIKYCSKECQLNDWQQHKGICKSLTKKKSRDM